MCVRVCVLVQIYGSCVYHAVSAGVTAEQAKTTTSTTTGGTTTISSAAAAAAGVGGDVGAVGGGGASSSNSREVVSTVLPVSPDRFLQAFLLDDSFTQVM